LPSDRRHRGIDWRLYVRLCPIQKVPSVAQPEVD
jgi:hypothetical protein